MARENQTSNKKSCVTCKHGIACDPIEHETVFYTEIVKTTSTHYHCRQDKTRECQLGFELGKLWEEKEGDERHCITFRNYHKTCITCTRGR